MKKEWIWWTAGIILGLSLSLSGCGEKKSVSETSQPPVESAPALQTERTAPEGPPAPSASDDQSPSGPNKEKNPPSGRKSQRG